MLTRKKRMGWGWIWRAAVVGALVVMAAEPAVAQEAEVVEKHGPQSREFLSHRFQLEPHRYDSQLNLHFGLSQPILLNGFNVAVDYRIGRWVFEYSHGMFLDFNASEFTENQFVGDTGADLDSPWTTGAGVGFILLDDLYLLLEGKAHHYELVLNGERRDYTTVSLGPALAYRLFIWRGLNITAYLRYWPNIWASEDDDIQVGGQSFEPVNLGLFGNLSLGWAFDL